MDLRILNLNFVLFVKLKILKGCVLENILESNVEDTNRTPGYILFVPY